MGSERKKEVVAVTAILPGPPPRAVSPVNDKVQQSVTTAHTPLALTRKGLTATNHWQHTTPPPVMNLCSTPCFQFQAMTGESIVSKCQKAKKSLEKSLVQIQDMVPVMLAAEVL
ncbi:hypothetical protein P8452_03989 [Trifolium repens]|nr:hypothetical protein P8452_03989 [Trifolium repens]